MPTETPMVYTGERNCGSCNATGVDETSEKIPCVTCNGEGVSQDEEMNFSDSGKCITCNGDGEHHLKCGDCEGGTQTYWYIYDDSGNKVETDENGNPLEGDSSEESNDEEQGGDAEEIVD